MIDRRRKHLCDTTAPGEAEALDLQATLWDPVSIEVLERTGVGPGWRCLEVGPAGTIAAWLGEQVVPGGHVVAAELAGEWPASAAYDLVHARLALFHHADRDVLLPALVEAVRPGGWLVVEDIDLGANHLTEPVHPTWTRFGAAARQALGQTGVDPTYGRRLPSALRAAGLVDVRADVTTFLRPVSEIGLLMRPIYSRVRPEMGDLGLVTDAEIRQVLGEAEDPDAGRWSYAPLLVSACGRQPG